MFFVFNKSFAKHGQYTPPSGYVTLSGYLPICLPANTYQSVLYMHAYLPFTLSLSLSLVCTHISSTPVCLSVHLCLHRLPVCLCLTSVCMPVCCPSVIVITLPRISSLHACLLTSACLCAYLHTTYLQSTLLT